MKTETPFEKLCKDVYKTIGLEYKPTTYEEDEIVAVDSDIRKFSKKTKSYNINKDNLRVHYASKKLSKFIEESERKRREKDSGTHDADQLHKKEQLVDFINQLTSKAKIEKLHHDSEIEYKAEAIKVDALQELTHVTGVMKADRLIYEEQQRRVNEIQERDRQSQTIHMLNQLTPVHDQLTEAFNRGGGDCKQALHHARSAELLESFAAVSSDEDLTSKQSIEMNCQMKSMLNTIKYNPAENPSNTIIPNDVIHGVGHIGRSLKRCDKSFQNNLQEVSKNTERKQTMQNELIYKVAVQHVKDDQKEEGHGYEHERKMTLVLDSLVHKAMGKEVEKEIDIARAEERIKEARKSTLEDIEDFGRRMSVVKNAKDVSYTNIKHDDKAQKVFDGIVTSLGGDRPKEPEGTTVGQPGLNTVSSLRKSSHVDASRKSMSGSHRITLNARPHTNIANTSPIKTKPSPAAKSDRSPSGNTTMFKPSVTSPNATTPKPNTSPVTLPKLSTSPATFPKSNTSPDPSRATSPRRSTRKGPGTGVGNLMKRGGWT